MKLKLTDAVPKALYNCKNGWSSKIEQFTIGKECTSRNVMPIF